MTPPGGQAWPTGQADAFQAARGFRPTRILVDLDAIAANLRLLRARMGGDRELLGIVKAEAYGHGAVPVARRLAAEGVEMLGVALPEEGIELRRAGLSIPILVLGAFSTDQIRIAIEHDLTLSASSLPILDRLLAEAPRASAPLAFHLKLDTGMGRLGVLPDQVPEALQRIRAAGAGVQLDGVLTHLSCGDDPLDPHTRRQVDLFAALLESVRQAGFAPRRVHMAGSGGILNEPRSLFTLARPGIALYGLSPSGGPAPEGLRPALQLVTRVVLIKPLPAGATLGYGHEGRTTRDSIIGTLDAGYADGLPRLAFPGGWALVQGRRAPFLGRISMDHAMVDLTDVPHAREGDDAVLIGEQGGETISAHTFAGWGRTLAYEALTRLGPRVPRMHLTAGGQMTGLLQNR